MRGVCRITAPLTIDRPVDTETAEFRVLGGRAGGGFYLDGANTLFDSHLPVTSDPLSEHIGSMERASRRRTLCLDAKCCQIARGILPDWSFGNDLAKSAVTRHYLACVCRGLEHDARPRSGSGSLVNRLRGGGRVDMSAPLCQRMSMIEPL